MLITNNQMYMQIKKAQAVKTFRKKLSNTLDNVQNQQQSLPQSQLQTKKQTNELKQKGDLKSEANSNIKSSRKADNRKTNRSLWTTTAQALTRFRSPSHRVPQAKRFTSLQQERQKNFAYHTLQLHIPSSKNSKNIKFPNSQRKENFLYKDEENYPAPSTYNKVRYLDNSFYKRNIDLEKIRAKIMTQNQSRNTEDDKNFLQQTFVSQQSKKSSDTQGRTFYRFNKHNKLYMPHAKNMIYQPDFVQDYPGQGSYSVQFNNKRGPSYSLRKVLKRWIDPCNIETPGNGPATYEPYPKDPQSIHWLTSTKGTFQKSNRTYLVHPQTESPGPIYNVKRYLQNNSQTNDLEAI